MSLPANAGCGGRNCVLSGASDSLKLQQQTRTSDAIAHIGLQMFRAGSAIGASIEEGQVANSRRDMAAKHAIALREARETEALEFVAMLTVSVKKLRERS